VDSTISILITVAVSNGDYLELEKHAVSFDKDVKGFDSDHCTYFRESDVNSFLYSLLPGSDWVGSEIVSVDHITSVNHA